MTWLTVDEEHGFVYDALGSKFLSDWFCGSGFDCRSLVTSRA